MRKSPELSRHAESEIKDSVSPSPPANVYGRVSPVSYQKNPSSPPPYDSDPSPFDKAAVQLPEQLPEDTALAAVDLQKILRKPNVDDQGNIIDQVIKLVNPNGEPGATTSNLPSVNVIDQGHIGILINNGEVWLVGPGRYAAWSPYSSWEEVNVKFNQPIIQCRTMTIVRVPAGQYALATHSGNPVILAPGLHAYNDPQFKYQKHVAIHEAHIQHGTIHIIRVSKGECALVSENNRPHLLPAGVHAIMSNAFQFDGLQKLNQKLIRHGTITRYRVRKGEIGLVWDENNPIFVDKPGFYFVDSPSFKFVDVALATDKHIKLGALQRIIVNESEVGISYQRGELSVLAPGIHVFDSPEIVFKEFMTTTQQSLHLNNDNDKEDCIKCETQDLVPVGIRADVLFKIVDPHKALVEVGDLQKIQQIVRDNAVGTLQSIVRSNNLKDVATSTRHATTVGSKGKEDVVGDDQQQFLDRIHDVFIDKLHDMFIGKYGIEITNIRVENFKLMNAELANNISQQAVNTAKTQTQLTNLEGQNLIATSTQQREAEVARIKADTEAYKVTTANKAENAAMLAKAETNAQAILVEAKAKAQAQEMLNVVTFKRYELLHGLMGQEGFIKYMLAEKWGEVTQSNMAGVDKVVYMPFDPKTNPVSLAGNPMGFLQTMREDDSVPRLPADQPVQRLEHK